MAPCLLHVFPVKSLGFPALRKMRQPHSPPLWRKSSAASKTERQLRIPKMGIVEEAQSAKLIVVSWQLAAVAC